MHVIIQDMMHGMMHVIIQAMMHGMMHVIMHTMMHGMMHVIMHTMMHALMHAMMHAMIHAMMHDTMHVIRVSKDCSTTPTHACNTRAACGACVTHLTRRLLSRLLLCATGCCYATETAFDCYANVLRACGQPA